ncbi:hypothetical protein LLG34_01415 [bacterium]|nr:hypothetical protein [bacterium]
MAEINKTLTEFENFIQVLIVSLLGWDITNPVKTNDVKIAWEEGGQPAASITDNVVYIECFEVDTPYNRAREEIDIWEISPDEFTKETSYTRQMQVNLILYGPDSFDNAQTIRDNIFYPDNQLTLQQNHIYLVHDISSPKRVPEYFQGLWWKRIDMSLRFNELVVKSISVPAITSIEVGIYDDNGNLIADITE